mgnify:CR=1 FL=1
MKALIQRVTFAAVDIDRERIGEIGPGLAVLLGIHQDDTAEIMEKLVEKLVNLRIFKDTDGKMNLSSLDVKAEILVISQFTLYADCRKGRRPGFTGAAPPDKALTLYQKFVQQVSQYNLKTQTGRFGEHMQVTIHNNGPVTILLDSDELG